MFKQGLSLDLWILAAPVDVTTYFLSTTLLHTDPIMLTMGILWFRDTGSS